MKIKVKEIVPGCKFEIIDKGDWIDLRAACDVRLTAPQSTILHQQTVNGEIHKYRDVEINSQLIPLGIAMQLPKGFEAHVLARSGTYKHYGLITTNSMGIIDCTYCGDNDQWMFNGLQTKHGIVHKGDRICQFRIELSQKATIWQKIKWLFTNKIEFEWVDTLGNKNRGGFGTTGVK